MIVCIALTVPVEKFMKCIHDLISELPSHNVSPEQTYEINIILPLHTAIYTCSMHVSHGDHRRVLPTFFSGTAPLKASCGFVLNSRA